jgi:hypothetical protein
MTGVSAIVIAMTGVSAIATAATGGVIANGGATIAIVIAATDIAAPGATNAQSAGAGVAGASAAASHATAADAELNKLQLTHWAGASDAGHFVLPWKMSKYWPVMIWADGQPFSGWVEARGPFRAHSAPCVTSEPLITQDNLKGYARCESL